MPPAEHTRPSFVAFLVALLPGLTGEAGAQAAPPQPVLRATPEQSRDGTVSVTWSSPDGSDFPTGTTFELELVDPANDGRLTTHTTFHASSRSGLDDGRYEFRVRARDAAGRTSDWSEPVVVEVEHHSLGLAFTVFGIGLFVLTATAGFIFVQSRRERAGADSA